MKRATGDYSRIRRLSLWEEDFSAVKSQIEELRQTGVTDLRAFYTSHREALLECIGKIKVLDVNQATMAMVRAENKGQLTGSLPEIIRIEASSSFVDEIVSIAEGRSDYTWESINYTRDGEKLPSACAGRPNPVLKIRWKKFWSPCWISPSANGRKWRSSKPRQDTGCSSSMP